jgi:hypothetical protein
LAEGLVKVFIVTTVDASKLPKFYIDQNSKYRTICLYRSYLEKI